MKVPFFRFYGPPDALPNKIFILNGVEFVK